MRPHIASDFGHLCAQKTPYTDFLFGDDVTKQIKDIAEDNRLAGKLSLSNNLKWNFGRGRPRAGRGRGRAIGGRFRGRGCGRFSKFPASQSLQAFLSRRRLQQLPFSVKEKDWHPCQQVDMAKVHFPIDIVHSDSALDTPPVAGRLAKFLPAWQNITSDMYVLNLVSGLHVEFDSGSPPLQQQVPPPIRFEDWEVLIIEQELEILLRKGDC